MKDHRDYFTVNELAKRHQVSTKTIYRRIWAGTIPASKHLVTGFWRIYKKDIWGKEKAWRRN